MTPSIVVEGRHCFGWICVFYLPYFSIKDARWIGLLLIITLVWSTAFCGIQEASRLLTSRGARDKRAFQLTHDSNYTRCLVIDILYSLPPPISVFVARKCSLYSPSPVEGVIWFVLIRHVHNTTDCQFKFLFCPSVCMHETIQQPLNRFSWNSIPEAVLIKFVGASQHK